MKFVFTDHQHKTVINVWYKDVFIGQLKTQLRENKDLDWKMLRANKHLTVDVSDRWKVEYIIVPTIRAFDGNQLAGKFFSKEEAAEAILNFHKQTYVKEQSDMSARSSAG